MGFIQAGIPVAAATSIVGPSLMTVASASGPYGWAVAGGVAAGAAIAKKVKSLEGGGRAAKVSRVNQFQAAWNQVKDDVSKSLARINPDFRAVDTQVGRAQEIVGRIRDLASGTMNAGVSDAAYAVEDAYSQIVEASETLRRAVDDMNSKIEIVTEGEKNGQIQVGTAANVALNELKKEVRDVEAALKAVNAKLASFSRVLSRAQITITADYNRRKTEEDAQRQYQDYLDRQERERERQEQLAAAQAAREEAKRAQEAALAERIYEQELRRQEQLDAAASRRQLQDQQRLTDLNSIARESYEDRVASYNPSWSTAGSGSYPSFESYSPTIPPAVPVPTSYPTATPTYAPPQGQPVMPTGYAPSPIAENPPELVDPGFWGGGGEEASREMFGLRGFGNFVPFERAVRGGMRAQFMRRRTLGADLNTTVRARVRELIEAAQSKAKATAALNKAGETAQIMAAQGRPLPVDNTETGMGSGTKIAIGVGLLVGTVVVVKKLSKKGR